MSYSVSLDDVFFHSLSIDSSSYNIYSMDLQSFPPSFLSYLKNINSALPKDDRLTLNDMGSYRYMQGNPSFPTVYNLNYTSKKSSDFFEYFNSLTSYDIENKDITEIYPIAVRYTNGKNLWVIERPPFKATVTYRQTRSSSDMLKEKIYDIWMPWTIMVLNVDFSSSSYESLLFFNDKPLQSLEDKLVPCFFPNIYGDGRMCLNQTFIGLQQHLTKTQSFNISTVYNYIINDYMSGGWNLDLGSHNYDFFLHLRSDKDKSKYPFLNRLNETVLLGNKSLKIKPATNLTLKRKINASLAHFSSMSSEEMLQLVSESIDMAKSNRSTSLDQILPTLSQSSKSLKTFSDFFYSFARTTTPSLNSSFVLILSPELDLQIKNNDNSYIQTLMSTLKTFITKYHYFENASLLKDHEYYNNIQRTNNPYVYAKSIDEVYLISSVDSTFSYLKEDLNV